MCQTRPVLDPATTPPRKTQTRSKGTDRGPPHTQTQGKPTPKITPTPKPPHKPDRTNRQNQSRGDQALRAQARLSLNPDALVEPIAKGQAHQATGKGHIAHALVEIPSKGQALQAAGQNHFCHVLVETIDKGEALQAIG